MAVGDQAVGGRMSLDKGRWLQQGSPALLGSPRSCDGRDVWSRVGVGKGAWVSPNGTAGSWHGAVAATLHVSISRRPMQNRS